VENFKQELPQILHTAAFGGRNLGFDNVRLWLQDEARIGLLPIVRH
jgi:hypothetical protein